MRMLLVHVAVTLTALAVAGCAGPIHPVHGIDQFGDLGDLHVVKLPSKYVFRLPDLTIARIDCGARSGVLFVTVTVHNGGSRDAGPFDVVAQVEGPSGTFSVPQRSTATLAQGNDTPQLGFLFTDVPIPGTFTVTAVADPPTASMPGGEVWEWDKNNNASLRTCTLQ